MASEATKLAVIGNKYILVRVIEGTELDCEVRSDLGPCYHWRTLIFRAIALLLSQHSCKMAMLKATCNEDAF